MFEVSLVMRETRQPRTGRKFNGCGGLKRTVDAECELQQKSHYLKNLPQ
jgi:hypothetical protein